MDKIILFLILSLSIVWLFFGIWLYVDWHDAEIDLTNHVRTSSCLYLKNFIAEEKDKWNKHPWYDLAVKKVNSPECNEDITESTKSKMEQLYDSWEKEK